MRQQGWSASYTYGPGRRHLAECNDARDRSVRALRGMDEDVFQSAAAGAGVEARASASRLARGVQAAMGPDAIQQLVGGRAALARQSGLLGLNWSDRAPHPNPSPKGR